MRIDPQGLSATITSAEGRRTVMEQFAGGRMRRIVDAAGQRLGSTGILARGFSGAIYPRRGPLMRGHALHRRRHGVSHLRKEVHPPADRRQ